MKPSGIGGQAVIEGIMMKNKDMYSVAVRKPDGEIEVNLGTYRSILKNKMLRETPLIRGVVNFLDSMILGMRTLTFSASFYEDEEEPTKADEMMDKIFKGNAEKVVTGLTVAFSIVMAVGIFMILPYFLTNFLRNYVVSNSLLAVIEGVVRVGIFILYVLLISRMEDIQRVFMYHGAEHKCINCIENGMELTVENVLKSSKHHKRCGTSFMFIVMVVSIIFFIFIDVTSPVLRVVIRLLLIPVIAGVSYELIKLAGRSESKFVQIISYPGMLMQRLTTKEPDAQMVEVAIAAVEAVFDWDTFIHEELEEVEV
ncbi:MAG: DUF1385 domain-containing protein [Lachnospiraceae bacterium]|nr:DUF1385 domain-containing protein [Lachnospiraceae bacterium]